MIFQDHKNIIKYIQKQKVYNYIKENIIFTIKNNLQSFSHFISTYFNNILHIFILNNDNS